MPRNPAEARNCSGQRAQHRFVMNPTSMSACPPTRGTADEPDSVARSTLPAATPGPVSSPAEASSPVEFTKTRATVVQRARVGESTARGTRRSTRASAPPRDHRAMGHGDRSLLVQKPNDDSRTFPRIPRQPGPQVIGMFALLRRVQILFQPADWNATQVIVPLDRRLSVGGQQRRAARSF
jgi:hypothetical protein